MRVFPAVFKAMAPNPSRTQQGTVEAKVRVRASRKMAKAAAEKPKIATGP